MENRKISVQLCSVRDELDQDIKGTLAKLAEIGFRYVEPAGYRGLDVKDFARALSEAGLQAPSMHGKLPVGDNKNQAIEEALSIGAKYVITGGPVGGWETWDSSDSIKRKAELYNQAAENAAPHGIQVGFHNHDKEMQDVDGRPAYRIFLETAAPEVLWTIDTYWVQVGGRDPQEVIKEAGARTKILHIKDGPGVKDEPMVAAGDGIMNFPPLITAAEYAEYLCIELDSCATDMMTAVKKSFHYLQNLN